METTLSHLTTVKEIDRVLAAEADRVVILRFSAYEDDALCQRLDRVLRRASAYVRRFGVVYAVDLTHVPECPERWGVSETAPFAVQFFFRSRHMRVDCGTGDHNQLTGVVPSVRDMVDMTELVYRQARRGKGLAALPRDIRR